jgi:hypothetical protein
MSSICSMSRMSSTSSMSSMSSTSSMSSGSSRVIAIAVPLRSSSSRNRSSGRRWHSCVAALRCGCRDGRCCGFGEGSGTAALCRITSQPNSENPGGSLQRNSLRT